jgi:hypothetical protein
VLDRLARDPFNEDGSENPQAFRLSDQLTDEFLEQVTNETRRVRFVKNRPVIEFQPKRAGAPTEGLDCTVYALAVRQSRLARTSGGIGTPLVLLRKRRQLSRVCLGDSMKILRFAHGLVKPMIFFRVFLGCPAFQFC